MASLVRVFAGRIAQLVRAPALHAGCRGFESLFAHAVRDSSPKQGHSPACRGMFDQRFGGTTVKASHRFVLPAASLAVALIATTAPAVARAQRGQAPGPDTPRILVTNFRGDREAGVKLADAIRDRIGSEFSARTLYATPKKDIENTLKQSGYPADSALSPGDAKELAKLVRADEIIDGSVTKTPSGYRVNARLFLPRDAALSQPLVSTESNNLGDVAKQIVHEYDAARKQIPAVQECENNLRAQKVDAATAA